VILWFAFKKKLEMAVNIGWNAFVQEQQPPTTGHFE